MESQFSNFHETAMKLRSKPPLQEVPDPLASHRVSEFSEGLGLNLPDTLSGNFEALSYFFQCQGMAAFKTKSQDDHFPFPWIQPLEHLFDLFS